MPQDSKDDGPGRPAYAGDSEEEEDDYQRGIWRDDKPDNKWNYFWTLGGRVRASTTGLIAGLGVVGLLLLSSANPDGVDAGWLSPSRWMGQSESTSESAQPSASSSAPLTTPQEAPATDSTGSAEQEPTAEVDPDTPTDSTPDSEAVYAPADPQDAETQAPVEQNSEAPAPTANEQPSAIVSEGAAEPSTVM